MTEHVCGSSALWTLFRWNGGVLKGIRRTLFSSKVIFRVQGLCCCDSVADGRGYVVEIGVE